MTLASLIVLRDPILQQAELRAPWGIGLGGCGHPGMYLVHRGEARIAVGSTSTRLGQGDLVLLSASGRHALTDARGTAPFDDAQLAARQTQHSDERGVHIRIPGTGPETVLSAVPFAASQSFSFLPAMLHVRREEMDEVTRALVASYEGAFAHGDRNVVARVAEALWLRLLATRFPALERLDISVLRAAARVTENPGAPHSIASLARAAGLSRTRFCARFAEAFGESPMHWVARARMQSAERLLATGRGVAEIAEAVGFADERAFRRAYLRVTGRRARVAR